MKKRILKYLVAFGVLAILAMPTVSLAQAATPTSIDLGLGDIGTTIGLSSSSPLTTVALLINSIMVILGIVAVGIVLLAGFKWMTAGGNDEKVTEAKKLMGAGVIGLVIILSAWGITTFILEKIVSASGTNIATPTP